ncbi:MAG TPA: hypothetical protein VMD29_07175 [Terracidiphilus sp.]|nr:hypothetical protein [Terracidiphilus sp.]
MSYTPPYSNFVANLGGVHYGLVHFGLATAAYTFEDFPLGIASQLAGVLGKMAPIPDVPGPGYWNLDWGPAIYTSTGALFNDNMIALVSYRVGASPNGVPCFFAVMCRGTDIGGGIAQISEDVDAFDQQPWINVLNGIYTYGDAANGMAIQSATSAAPPNPSGAVIATGSADGLIAVTNLVEYGQLGTTPAVYLVNALRNLLSQFPGTPVVVTGHSLGGALTQVLAAYLAWQVSDLSPVPQIIPQAFAPPTAGDPNFIAYYDLLFAGGNQFWVNVNDLVPTAFSSLISAGTMWGLYSWPSGYSEWSPTFFGTGTDLISHGEYTTAQALIAATVARYIPPYARPSTVQLMPSAVSSLTLPTQAEMQAFLTSQGANPNDWTTWASQLMYQHLTPTYYSLVSKVSGVMAYPYVTLPPTPPLS